MRLYVYIGLAVTIDTVITCNYHSSNKLLTISKYIGILSALNYSYARKMQIIYKNCYKGPVHPLAILANSLYFYYLISNIHHKLYLIYSRVKTVVLCTYVQYDTE